MLLSADLAGAAPRYTLESFNRRAEYFYRRALHRREVEDEEGALADLTRALEYRPDHARAYLERARTNLQLGRQSAAAQDCKRALALQPLLLMQTPSERLCRGAIALEARD